MDFKNIVIIVDDGSTDNSKQEIKTYLQDYPEVQFLDLVENVGNTTAFNKGLALAKGKYIINYGLESERVYLMSGDVSLAAEFPKTNVSFSDYFDMKLYIPGVEKIQSVSFFILLH